MIEQGDYKKNIITKKFMLLIAFVLIFGQVFSQDYDLIVKSNGDSIACYIDSVTDLQIYFEVRYQAKWVKTSYEINQIVEYKMNQFHKNQIVFKGGSSVIKSVREFSEFNSLYEYNRNTLTLESNIVFTSVNYCRLFPLKNNNHLSVGAGINYFAFGDWFFTAESTLLFGGPKHFFEPGIELYIDIEGTSLYPGIGYRFQGFNGFLFKAYLGYQNFDEPGVMPMVAFGYSF